MKTVHIYLAEGFEEIEALNPADILRRAGAEVTLVSVTQQLTVTGAHGIRVIADSMLDTSAALPDMAVLPGGYPGYKNLAECEPLEGIIAAITKRGGTVAAICGAPAAVLGEKGFLKDVCAVCYPGMEDMLRCKSVPQLGVCSDSGFVTAKSAGYALDFALELTKLLFGEEKARETADGIVYHG